MEKREITIPILSEEDIQLAVEKALDKFFNSQSKKKEKSTPSKKPLSIEEACKFIGISKPTMYKWIKQGLVKISRINGRIFFTEESLINIIKENEMSSREAFRLKSRKSE